MKAKKKDGRRTKKSQVIKEMDTIKKWIKAKKAKDKDIAVELIIKD